MAASSLATLSWMSSMETSMGVSTISFLSHTRILDTQRHMKKKTKNKKHSYFTVNSHVNKTH